MEIVPLKIETEIKMSKKTKYQLSNLRHFKLS